MSDVTNRSNCPLCIAGEGGRHPDSGGTHPLRTAELSQEAVAARAKADPEYRRMLMDDADEYARQEGEERPMR